MGKCFPGSCQNFDTKQVEKMNEVLTLNFQLKKDTKTTMLHVVKKNTLLDIKKMYADRVKAEEVRMEII